MEEKMKKKMMNMKTYRKMVEEVSVKRKELPRAIEKRLGDFLAAGLLKQTRRGYYKKVEQEPAWVEAAKAVVAPEDVETEEIGQPVPENKTIWDEARLQTGQKAVNIVQIIDGLLSGEAGLSALTEIKSEAIGILNDLGLIQPVEEGV